MRSARETYRGGILAQLGIAAGSGAAPYTPTGATMFILDNVNGTAVPEPTELGMWGVLALALLPARRRNKALAA